MLELVIFIYLLISCIVLVRGISDASYKHTYKTGDKEAIILGHVIFPSYFIGVFLVKLLTIKIKKG